MRVFVSATSEDLADHREAAIRALRRVGHTVVAMEDMTAARTYPLDRVLEAVRSSDALVIIVAWRYGFVPDAAGATTVPPTAVPGTTSITEYEYLAAAETGIPIIPLLLDESAPWPPRHIDGFADEEVTLAPINHFRQQLMRDHIVSFFSTPDQLESLVTAAISNTRIAGHVLANLVHLSEPVVMDMIVPDSSYAGGIVAVVSAARDERVVTIDIAQEWWSTRLYLLAFMLLRLTRVERLLVVEEGRFVGLLPLNAVVRVVGPYHQELGRFEKGHRRRSQYEPDVSREAYAIVQVFEDAFANSVEREVQFTVSAANLTSWFDETLLTQPIHISNLSVVSALDLVRLLDYPSQYIPVVGGGEDSDGDVAIVNARTLSDQLAETYIAEMLESIGLGSRTR